ncbi:MAG: hypothetical protein JNM02_02040, partial [Anaerolineales bacterium]|nr:hypothetical protein [Anaerolineales bacterium]
MADTIKCPVCGKNNPASQELCQYCQSRLQPASNKNTDLAIQPGQIPTKKNTAELEPILPQWLKDARDSARNAMPQATPPDSQKPDQKPPATSSEDLLAGLSSQADDEEDETPDWLASITGSAPKPKKASTESSETRRVELGGKGDFDQETSSADSDTPAWLAGLTPKESQAEEKDELTDWFHSANESSPAEKPAETPSFDDSFSTTSSMDDTPDWLRQMAADEDAKKAPQVSSFDTTPAVSSDTPDWLRQMAADSDVQPVEPSMPDLNSAATTDTPDWLRGLEDKTQRDELTNFTEPGSGESEPPAMISTGELPAWLNDQAEEAKPLQDTTPKWLKKDAPASVTGELPAWLSGNEETVRLSASEEDTIPAQEESLGDLPDWLKAAAPQSTLFEEPAKESTSEPADASFDMPDWLNTFKTVEEEPQSESTPAVEKETPFDAPSAFNSDDQAGEDAENLFTEMPDWLSNAMELPDSSSPTPITNTDAISPGELPSWVQAMRPVDAPMSSLSSSPSFSSSSDQTLESRGALAGLQGVLPAVAGFTPTSKPKPYSIRLQASEEQQAHAELLEQILAAETAPVPIASFSALRASRSLRWFLVAAVFAAVLFGLFSGTPIFSMPL